MTRSNINKTGQTQNKLQIIKMTENVKIARECRRLETNMNVPPVDNYLHVRKLRSRNISYDIRHRQMDS